MGDVTDYRISADGKKMLVRSGESFAIADLPAGEAETREAARPEQHEGPARPPGGVEPDLPRMLAADARLPLRAEHAGGRLAARARAVRAAAALRQSPRRSDLRHRRDDRRVEHRALPTSAAATTRTRAASRWACSARRSSAIRPPATSASGGSSRARTGTPSSARR